MLQLFKRDDTHEFMPILAEIESNPVSPLGRLTFWTTVAVIVFVLIWTTVGEVDVVVSSVSAKVIPDGQVKILQPLDTGVISKILVKEGDFVKRGQTVMEIDPSSTLPEVASLDKNLNYMKLEGQRLQASLNGESFTPSSGRDSAALHTQQQLFQASQNSLLKQLGSKEQELKKIDQQIQSVLVQQAENRQLLSVSEVKEARLRDVKDIIAREEYERANNDLVSYKAKLDEADHRLIELKHSQMQVNEEIEHVREEYRTTNLQDLANKQKQMTDLEAKLKESSYKNAKQVIVSPVDGFVDTLFVHTLGGVVTPAEKLVSVVPANTPPIIEAAVSSRDIGFVQVNMPVSIKVDTFDFQKYGMFDGKVSLISKDSRQDEKLGTVYDVYMKPTTPYLLIDGARRALTPGMSVVSEIKVGKRHIIEFFVYPLIKYMHEGMSVR